MKNGKENQPRIFTRNYPSIKKITDLGYKIIINTNQRLISKGIIKLEDYKKYIENLIKELNKNKIEVLDIFFWVCQEKCVSN